MIRQFITEIGVDDEDYQKDIERLRELEFYPIEEHDSEIGAEATRDFAEWYFTKYFNSSQKDIDNILSEYEKEHKNGTR